MRHVRIALLCCAAFLPARAETLLVLHKRADSLGIYDGATGASLARIAVGRKPHEIALSPDNRLVYVTDYGCDRWTEDIPGGNTVSIVDLAKRAKVGEIGLGEYRRPHGIERGASGLFYVTTDFPAALLAIDAGARRIARVWKVGQKLPHMVAVDRAERTAWVANAGSASATAIDLASGNMKHIAVGGIPMGVNLSPDESFVYVTTRTADTVAVIDTAKRERVADIRIPGQPVRMSFTPDGKTLVVTLIDAGDVAVVDVATRRVVHRFHAGTSCEGINVDRAGKFAYVSAQGDNKVVKFAVDGWKRLAEIGTGERPDPILILETAPENGGLLDAFSKRQTVRRYKPDPVPEDHVRQILDAARRAPTCMNQQPWKFLVIRKPETIARMKEETLALLTKRFEKSGLSAAELEAKKKKSVEFTSGYFTAPVYVVVLVDSESACAGYALRHDGPIAAGYLMIAARAFGYGTAYLTDGIPDRITREVLKIPERYKRICITPIGVPDGWPREQQKRRLEEMVAYETLEGHPPLEKLPYNP